MWGENRSTLRKLLSTSLANCRTLKPETSNQDSNPHFDIGGMRLLGKQKCKPLHHVLLCMMLLQCPVNRLDLPWKLDERMTTVIKNDFYVYTSFLALFLFCFVCCFLFVSCFVCEVFVCFFLLFVFFRFFSLLFCCLFGGGGVVVVCLFCFFSEVSGVRVGGGGLKMN